MTSASAIPPTVEAVLGRPSLRSSQYTPSPARMGWITTYHRMAAPQDRTENRNIAGTYIHPDWGSPANRTPASASGFHAGMWPAARLLPRKQYWGSTSDRMSPCWFVTRPPKAMSWYTASTAPTITTGPATARPTRDAVGGAPLNREPSRGGTDPAGTGVADPA